MPTLENHDISLIPATLGVAYTQITAIITNRQLRHAPRFIYRLHGQNILVLPPLL